MKNIKQKTLIVACICIVFLAICATNAIAYVTINDGIIYGYITGDSIEGINVVITKVECSGETDVNTLITDENGYYSIGDLDDGYYYIYPEDYDYTFYPEGTLAKLDNNY